MFIALEGQILCANKHTGIGRYALNMIKSIIESDKKNNYEITYFDFLKRNHSKEKIHSTINIGDNTDLKACNYLPYGIFARYNGFIKPLSYKLLTGSKAGIFHFFNSIVPANSKFKTISTVYDMVYKLYPETMNQVNYNIHKRYLEDSCHRSDRIITISENSKREIMEFFNIPEEKITATYCSVDHSIFYPQRNLEYIKSKYNIDGEYILYLGTLEPRKNITSLIKAFSILSERFNDIKLVLAGGKGWLYDEIFSMVKGLKLENKIIFPGYVDDSDIPMLYSSAEMFVFPSLYEGFGIPPLEAMACGTPVIVSNTSSLPEVVGDAGVLVEPKNVENIAFEMERLLSDCKLREGCSRKGLEQAARFSWVASARIILDVYKGLE